MFWAGFWKKVYERALILELALSGSKAFTS
jgi:hypothetical protein